MSAQSQWRFVVSGRVQGVAFRVNTRMQALKLGLRGHARNLADGRVEVLVAGDAASLAALGRWLTVGPALARVSALEQEEWAAEVPHGFLVL